VRLVPRTGGYDGFPIPVFDDSVPSETPGVLSPSRVLCPPGRVRPSVLVWI